MNETEQRATILRHLHAMVWYDYVDRLVPCDVIDDIGLHGRKLIATPASGGTNLFQVPLEFAWGAFQVPHAMIREKYEPWGLGPGKAHHPPGSATLATLLRLTYGGNGLVSGRLDDDWRIDWDTMLGKPGVPPPTPAARMSSRLRRDVFLLPGHLFTVKRDQPAQTRHNLAFRTMSLARKMRVPSGQRLAQFAKDAGAQLNVLGPDVLAGGLGAAARAAFVHKTRSRAALSEQTPLWFYCLRECERQGGECYGPLGGRIVAETLHAAIEAADPGFFDRQSGWSAGQGHRLPARQAGKFDLYDLRRLAMSFNP